jgi:hypothetical protein
MKDLTKRVKRYGERQQTRLQHLHGLLVRLQSEIPRERAGAYVLNTTNSSRDMALRSWELYETELDDPLVELPMREYETKFPLRKPTGN